MKKYFFFVLLISSQFAFAQFNKSTNHNRSFVPTDSVFQHHPNTFHPQPKTQLLISAGYGLLYFGSYVHFNLQNATTLPTVTGPLYFKAELKMIGSFGVGINGVYSSAKMDEPLRSRNGPTQTIQHTFTSYGAILRVNYHFTKSTIIDPYIGLGMGYCKRTDTYSIAHYRNRNSGAAGLPNIPIGADFTFGLNYQLLKNLYVYSELGLAKSLFQGGVQFRF